MLVARLDRWTSLTALVVLVAWLAAASDGSLSQPPRTPAPPLQPGAAANAPISAGVAGWPPSSGLLVAEVVTRGSAASDQYVELYNAAQVPLSLGGLELVYVTASGATVTHKQSWSELVLQSRQRLLIANSAGAYATMADGLFSGGFSTTGGTLVLRTPGGSVIDSLSWGSATNSFVEGTPGIAPPTGSSLERRPGGSLGNAIDTNDNATDTFVQPQPSPDGLSAPPAPAIPPPASDPPDPPLPDPPMTDSPPPDDPGFEDDPPFDDPDEQPEATPDATPGSSPVPSPTPVPSPNPTPLAVSQVRSLPPGSAVAVGGVLTTPLGLTESGKGAFIQDETAGIAIYLASGTWTAAAAGRRIVVSGVLETRFSLLTVRAESAADASIGEPAELPDPLEMAIGEVGEQVESRLVVVEGVISDGISMLTDGFSTAISDGTGSIRVIVATASGINAEALSKGRSVSLRGVVGQRDTSGTGLAGYRLHLRGPSDIAALDSPTPSPPSESPGTEPSPDPSASPAPSPTPTPAPTAQTHVDIASARQLAVGQTARVQGVVTVAAGPILGDRTLCMQDGTAGICVRLPDAGPGPGRGTVISVEGVLAAPYGNLELRPAAGGVVLIGVAALPAARPIDLADLGDATEGLLVRVSGTLKSSSAASSGTITLILEDGSGEGRVFIHAALDMSRAQFNTGQRLTVTGIVGDRLGLFRVWPREAGDFQWAAAEDDGTPAAGAPSPSPTGGPALGAPILSIAEALGRPGQKVSVQGVVTAPAALLDADGRRITIQDSSGAVLLRLPLGGAAPAVGEQVRVSGEIGTYYGAPQLAASDAPVVLGRVSVQPTYVGRAPFAANLEWRLVRVTGVVESVQRSGDAWRAELAIDGGSVPVVGLARSGIPSDALVKGRNASVTGLVRRAYPTATDQRLAVVPRAASDIDLGGAAGSDAPGQPADQPSGDAGHAGDAGSSPDGGAGPGRSGGPRVPAVALADLAAHEGERVLVGGRVVQLEGDRLVIDDGSATATVILDGDAQAVVPLLKHATLVNAEGVVQREPSGRPAVRTDDPADITFVGAAAASTLPPPGEPSSAPPQPAAGPQVPADPAGHDVLPGVLAIIGLLGLVSGSAGALMARQPRHRQALRAAVVRLRARFSTLVHA